MSEQNHPVSPPAAKECLLIVCPGRGTYNQAEWGSLTRHAAGSEWLARFDALRRDQDQPTLSELDSEIPFRLGLHGRGDHASPLIYACALADVLAIDRERYEICAVTGNSMGWYIALVIGGALAQDDAFTLINTMGHLMQESLNGGQLLYPWVDDQWRPQPERRQELLVLIEELHGQDGIELYLSIELGGMLVFGGNEAGLKRLGETLPAIERFPMRLHQHAAFHTPMQEAVKADARQRLPATPFGVPEVPLIDGRGKLWSPWSTDPEALWDYTLGEQLVTPYDFTTALKVGVREFAPDRIVIPGPGTTLGGAVAQVLIQLGWWGLDSKSAFQDMQRDDPRLISMGMEEQREWLLKSE